MKTHKDIQRMEGRILIAFLLIALAATTCALIQVIQTIKL